MDDIVCGNINKCCDENVHNIIDKMLPDKIRNYLFNWDEFSVNNIDGLMDFLRVNCDVNGIKKENIKIIKQIYDNCEARIISTGKISLSFKLHNNRIFLEINGVRYGKFDDKFVLKMENGKRNIYFKVYEGNLFKGKGYPILEGKECFQYLQEYVPFHLPQIEYVLKDVMLKHEFDDMTPNIIDLGSGPATVPLAFCRLDPNQYPYEKFNITTVEASKTFNDMISVFERMNKNKTVEIDCKFNCNITDFMNSAPRYNIGYNWIIAANSISAIGKSGEEANKRLNKFIFNVLNCNKKLGYSNSILLTIIEGGLESYFHEKIKYLSEIGNIIFDDLEIKDTLQPSENKIKDSRIKKCEFYNFKNSWMDKPNIYSRSLLLELKK